MREQFEGRVLVRSLSDGDTRCIFCYFCGTKLLIETMAQPVQMDNSSLRGTTSTERGTNDGSGDDLRTEGNDEEDVFQCGKCKKQFTSLEVFVTHKKECGKRSMPSEAATSADQETVPPPDDSNTHRPKRNAARKAAAITSLRALIEQEEQDLRRAIQASLVEAKKTKHVVNDRIETDNVSVSRDHKEKSGNVTASKLGTPDDSNAIRKKIPPQRKFAQGHNEHHSHSTPVKKATVNVPTTEVFQAIKPNTNDFLTYLCFRKTPSILPSHLDFKMINQQVLLSRSKNKSESRKKDTTPVSKTNGQWRATKNEVSQASRKLSMTNLNSSPSQKNMKATGNYAPRKVTNHVKASRDIKISSAKQTTLKSSQTNDEHEEKKKLLKVNTPTSLNKSLSKKIVNNAKKCSMTALQKTISASKRKDFSPDSQAHNSKHRIISDQIQSSIKKQKVNHLRQSNPLEAKVTPSKRITRSSSSTSSVNKSSRDRSGSNDQEQKIKEKILEIERQHALERYNSDLSLHSSSSSTSSSEHSPSSDTNSCVDISETSYEERSNGRKGLRNSTLAIRLSSSKLAATRMLMSNSKPKRSLR